MSAQFYLQVVCVLFLLVAGGSYTMAPEQALMSTGTVSTAYASKRSAEGHL